MTRRSSLFILVILARIVSSGWVNEYDGTKFSHSTTPSISLAPVLYLNATNVVTVLYASGSGDPRAAVDLTVEAIGQVGSANSTHVRLSQQVDEGTPATFTFTLGSPALRHRLRLVRQPGGVPIQEVLLAAVANVAHIEVHTDRPRYARGDTVRVRLLPLDRQGEIFLGELQVAFEVGWLVNACDSAQTPDGLQLSVVSRRSTNFGYVHAEYELAQSAQDGVWRVRVWPGADSYEASQDGQAWTRQFKVNDYSQLNQSRTESACRTARLRRHVRAGPRRGRVLGVRESTGGRGAHGALHLRQGAEWVGEHPVRRGQSHRVLRTGDSFIGLQGVDEGVDERDEHLQRLVDVDGVRLRDVLLCVDELQDAVEVVGEPAGHVHHHHQ